jgi:hypothetical protein
VSRQTYEYCAACGRHLTTAASERYLGDRWHPEHNWHPLVCNDEECAKLVRACPFFGRQPFPRPIRGVALRFRRETMPVHPVGCTCSRCEEKRRWRAEQDEPKRPARAPERPATQRKPRPGPTSPEFARMCREAKEKRAAARASCWDPEPK